MFTQRGSENITEYYDIWRKWHPTGRFRTQLLQILQLQLGFVSQISAKSSLSDILEQTGTDDGETTTRRLVKSHVGS